MSKLHELCQLIMYGTCMQAVIVFTSSSIKFEGWYFWGFIIGFPVILYCVWDSYKQLYQLFFYEDFFHVVLTWLTSIVVCILCTLTWLAIGLFIRLFIYFISYL
jgi:hypothetical protein